MRHKEKIIGLGTDVKVGTPTQDYIHFVRRIQFCAVHVKRKWLRLDLINVKDLNNQRIIPYPVGDWVYVHVEKKNDVDEVLEIVRRAYERAA